MLIQKLGGHTHTENFFWISASGTVGKALLRRSPFNFKVSP